MSALVFLDTETTGLDPTRDDIWELAAIRREPDGSERRFHWFVAHNGDRCRRLPEPFRTDHAERWPKDYDHDRGGVQVVEPRELATLLVRTVFVDRPHVVGAVPNFDTERIAVLLRRMDYGPANLWHYHLIDVEAMAIGYLAAEGMTLTLPWKSDALSEAVGVTPPDRGVRHTAMGDALWAQSMYDQMTGGRR